MNYIKLDGKEVSSSKIVCIGRNFVEHIKELNNEMPDSMVIFNKPNSSITNELKYFSKDTRYEGEICFLINNGEISGIGFGLDLTKADMQNQLKKKGLPWERSKSFNGAAVFSDFVGFKGDISKLKLELFINNKLIQSATTDLMIYKPAQMIEEINSFMTLDDGDIIMSGTPKGVGTYRVGDVFEGKIYCDDILIVEAQWKVK